MGIQVNFIFFLKWLIFSTFFKNNENLILYSEKNPKKTKTKGEKDKNVLRMHSLHGKLLNTWQFSSGVVRANLEKT